MSIATTLFRHHLSARMSFPGTWSRTNTKKWWGAVSLRIPPQGDTPLKFLHVYVLVCKGAAKSHWFFTVICILQFSLISLLFAQSYSGQYQLWRICSFKLLIGFRQYGWGQVELKGPEGVPLTHYSLPETHGHLGIISVNYLRVRLRRIEWQALRGWLCSAFWTYLFAEYLFPSSDCELQCVGRLLDGIALSSVRFFVVPFTNENTDQFPK